MAALLFCCPTCRHQFQLDGSADRRQVSCPACGRALGWFHARGQQWFGPIPFLQLRQELASGRVRPEDLVLQEGTSTWVLARTIPGLLPEQPQAPRLPGRRPARSSLGQQRWVWMVSLLLAGGVIAGLWFILPDASGPTPASGTAVEQFDPRFDPSATTQAAIDPKVGCELKLEDGARVVIPPGAVPQATTARLARLLNDPGKGRSTDFAGPVYEISLGEGGDLQPRRAVAVSLPLPKDLPPKGSRGSSLAVAQWDGQEWRPVPSHVDRGSGRVTARVLHFSPHRVVLTDQFAAGPALVLLDPRPDSRLHIPIGATVVCRWSCPRHPSGKAYTQVRAVGDDGCQFQDQSGQFASTGKVEVREFGETRPDQEHQLRFVMRVVPGARLGLHRLQFLTEDGGADVLFEDAFRVGNPLVIVVDIDGMRRDVFDLALNDTRWECPTLRKLAGSRMEKADRKGNRAWWAYEHGFALRETTTVFPSVTFAGHAAIFTGQAPGNLNMAGNEWFDPKEVRKFAFTGDNLGPGGMGLGDSLTSFMFGVANKRLHQSPYRIVYEIAAADAELKATGIVVHNMYYGDGKRSAAWLSMSLKNQIEYYITLTSPENDRAMTDKAIGALTYFEGGPTGVPGPGVAGAFGRRFPPNFPEPWSDEDFDRLGVLTLYYAGLDHLSHEEGEPAGVPTRQIAYYQDTLDPCLAAFCQALPEVLLRNATFVFTADHGQTTLTRPRGTPDANIHCFGRARTIRTLHKFQDLLYEMGYLPAGVHIGNVKSRLLEESFQVGPRNATALVGLNGGMAHVYLRRAKLDRAPAERRAPDATSDELLKCSLDEPKNFQEWSEPPTAEQVHFVAERLWKWNTVGWEPADRITERDATVTPESREYRGSLAMILLRIQEKERSKAEYRVYLGPDKESVPFLDYLKNHPGGQDFLKRSGWKDDRDAEYLANRLSLLQSPVSGDLILLPRYPDYYCEYEPLFGDHGSFTRSDMEVPFAVFRPGADEQQVRFIRNILATTPHIDLEGAEAPRKNRPSNTDVPRTVLALLHPEAPVPTESPVTVWRLKDGYPKLNPKPLRAVMKENPFDPASPTTTYADILTDPGNIAFRIDYVNTTAPREYHTRWDFTLRFQGTAKGQAPRVLQPGKLYKLDVAGKWTENRRMPATLKLPVWASVWLGVRQLGLEFPPEDRTARYDPATFWSNGLLLFGESPGASRSDLRSTVGFRLAEKPPAVVKLDFLMGARDNKSAVQYEYERKEYTPSELKEELRKDEPP